MPKFQVLRLVDAYVRYTAEVQADDPTQAAENARRYEENYQWEHDCTSEYDTRFFVTLDGQGDEIEGTQTGDMYQWNEPASTDAIRTNVRLTVVIT